MGLLSIKFTDGTQLLIIDDANVLGDDYFTMPSKTVVNYVQSSAFITGGDRYTHQMYNGEELNGKILTDLDGNVWTFVQTKTNQISLYIKSASTGTITTFVMDGFYSTNSGFLYFAKIIAVNNDGSYSIGFGRIRPALSNSRSLTGSITYMRTRYFDGSYGSLSYADDLDIFNTTVLVGNETNWLTNMSPTFTPFINLSGVYLNSTDTDFNGKYSNLMLLPSSAGGDITGSFTLSSNTVSNFIPGENIIGPYQDGQIVNPQGTPTTDLNDDDIGIPNLPSDDFSAVSTGLISLYSPTVSQMNSLATYMWTNNAFDLNTFKKILGNPIDAIMHLSIVPLNVTGNSSTVYIGNINTGISMNRLSKQYYAIDCGSINVTEYYKSCLDYEPYTRAELYLPYIGIRPVSIDDIMQQTVNVTYHVDVLSGACVAFVTVKGSVLYTFVGQCSVPIPLTSNDSTNIFQGVLGIAGSIGSMVASGGSTAPVAVPTMVSSAVNSLKPNIERSGGFGSAGGMLGIQKPYIIISRPIVAVSDGQQQLTGYPSLVTVSLGDVSGYQEIKSVNLAVSGASDIEMDEIKRILKEGVIL